MKKINKVAIGILAGLIIYIYCTALVPVACINLEYKYKHSSTYLCKNCYYLLPKSFQYYLDLHSLSIVFINKDSKLDANYLLGEYKSTGNDIIVYKTGDYERDLKTLIHEVAHFFDYDFSKRSTLRISGRADFMEVYLKERDNVFKEGDHHYTNNEYFSWAVSEFYINNSNLKNNCPKTYKWIEHNIDKCNDSYCNYEEYENNYLCEN